MSSYSFKLQPSFVEQFRGKQPKWGPLGPAVYYRTYSRQKDDGTHEEFWETLRRVVEGVYGLQKKHCEQARLPWSNTKAQRSAQEMFQRMWDFKFLPPGRGLWMMGTEHVQRTSSSLFNCCMMSTASVSSDFAEPFCWSMEMLMLGNGVGFDSLGANTITIKEPRTTETPFVVPDTREGWVAALRAVIDPFAGTGALPTSFDYSLVRPAGAPIRGFGGTASGPEPLDFLLRSIRDLLTARVGSKLTVTDINDMFNYIGKCVVAGNVRRSSLLSLGSADDPEFMLLKHPVINAARLKSHGWTANNSVSATVGMDYTAVADGAANNGEPGCVWLENLRRYGRMKDPANTKDLRIVGTNPCFAGDTLIATADGRNAVSIKQLAEEGRDVPVYSTDPKTGEVRVQWGRNPRITGYDKELLRISFTDGSQIEVTPDHKMLVRDGADLTEVLAKDIQQGHRLPRFAKGLSRVNQKTDSGNEYYRVNTSVHESSKYSFEHRLIAQFHEPKKWSNLYDESQKSGWVKGGIVVHHKDYNPLNNSPDNLEIMTYRDHNAFHAAHDCSGPNNGMWGKEHSENTKALISQRAKERMSDPEYKEMIRRVTMAGITDESRKAVSDAQRRIAREAWEKLEPELRAQGLDAELTEDGLVVHKTCECCHSPFVVEYKSRESAYCSRACANKVLNDRATEVAAKRLASTRATFDNKQLATRNAQIEEYKKLHEALERRPEKREWVDACKSRGVSHRIRTPGTSGLSPYAFTSWKEVAEAADVYNHCVASVERVDGLHTVYNITVDNFHTLAVVTGDTEAGGMKGVYVLQCGEIGLWSGENCNLVECFPANHNSYADFQRTLKLAYLYAKTVTLVPSHSEQTNAVTQRNRRIGCSVSGVTQAISKFGRREFFNMLDTGYTYLDELDKIYSDWLCIPRSIKMTTIKPSGSVSCLPGATSGMHYPHSEYYIRRVRMLAGSKLAALYEAHGYPVEADAYAPNTTVVSFPIKEENFTKAKADVSMWEQLELAASLQHYWADNSVSVTVTVKEEEKKDIKTALEYYETRLKSVSFLPLEDHKYEQAPYETITEDQYNALIAKISPISSYIQSVVHEKTEVFCSNDVCEVRLIQE